MIYPANFENKIGFDVLRGIVESKCISPLGENEAKSMAFSSDYDFVVQRLRETREFLSIIENGIEFPFNYVFDITSSLKRVKIEGSYLTENELFNLKRSLITISDIHLFFSSGEEIENQYPCLINLTSGMISFPIIVNEIEKILDKFGNIKDDASPELREIRKSILSTTSGINGILRRILSSGREQGIIDKDVTPSVRDGRLVIPVSPMHKRKIKGIVHDESATGKTIFIEPSEIVEANNRIRELEGEMRREIIRILISTTNFIRPHIDELLNSYEVLGKIDFIRAKAIVANDMGGMLPIIENKPDIEWYHTVHPILLITLREQQKTVIPLNITLSDKNRILLISGPNAGGKSVCLKTVGITQYMMQCGLLPILYENSHMGIFSNLFIDIGDEQSIEDDLSTYSSHLSNMKYFVGNGSESTLVLIDEFGGGTEPQIGGAIAQAILHNINDKKVWGVITTHYQNLKHFAEETDGIINGAMLYDRQKMQPLFQLSIGYPGSSFAIEIARKIGLPTNVINEAQEIVGSDYINMDKYLLDIARDRKYWENKRQDARIKDKKLSSLVESYETEINALKQERKEILKKAKTEAKEILAKSNSAIERTIHEIKLAAAEKVRTKELRQELDQFKAKLLEEENKIEIGKIKSANKQNKHVHEKKIKEPITPIGINDNVLLDNTTTVGRVISIEGKKATVAFGQMKTQVAMSRLKKTNKIQEEKTTQISSNIISNETRQRQLNFSPEIDLRGTKADEAIQAVTYFIDDAIQFNISRVRILHGTGNGILRQRIREYLNTVNGVHSYSDEHVQFGGAGITIVDLK